MAAPPLKAEISGPFPTPSNGTMRIGMGKLWDYVTGLLGATGNAADARVALGVGDQTGEMFFWPHASTPSHGLLCNGAAVSRATYAALFAKIGTTWGTGNGSTTFNLPNVPADYTVVQSSANEGTSTVGQVIAHTHPQAADTVRNTPGSGGVVGPSASAAGGTTGSTGGAANLAAGIRGRWCIRF